MQQMVGAAIAPQQIAPFPTLFNDAMKRSVDKSLIFYAYSDCDGKSHKKLQLLPMQVRPRWQKLWKTSCRQQKFPLEERESFVKACFPNGDTIMRWQLFGY